MLVIKIANWFASGQLGFLTLGATMKTTGLRESYVTPMKSVFLKAQSGRKKVYFLTNRPFETGFDISQLVWEWLNVRFATLKLYFPANWM